MAVQDLYRYSDLYLAYWRNQQFLACGCCIAISTLGMRGTVWRLGLEQTCGNLTLGTLASALANPHGYEYSDPAYSDVSFSYAYPDPYCLVSYTNGWGYSARIRKSTLINEATEKPNSHGWISSRTKGIGGGRIGTA